MFFFDTYAIFEIIHKKPSYLPYSKYTVYTTTMNMAELFYNLLRIRGHSSAEEIMRQLPVSDISFSLETLKDAMLFRFSHRGKGMSVVDCLGYILAKKHGLKFLTGDIAFKGLPNVEFVR